MRIIGIDPGLKGALALIEDGKLVEVVDIEASDSRINAVHLVALLRRWMPEFAVCELVTARPGQGVTSMFTFGHALGSITAILAALHIPYLLIRPQIWQSYFEIQSPSSAKAEHKREIADRAETLFPGAPLYGPRAALRDRRSDALLLASYAHDQLSGMHPDAFRDAHAPKPKPKPKKATAKQPKPRKPRIKAACTVTL